VSLCDPYGQSRGQAGGLPSGARGATEGGPADMIRASARKRANPTRERAQPPIMSAGSGLDQSEGYLSVGREAVMCCSGCAAASPQAVISDWARNPTHLVGERADLLIMPAEPPPGGAARTTGQAPACPRFCPKGP
jgi:hypothetical protein